MNVGMLWFDNDPRAGLNVKVERAVTYYRNKYSNAPTLCFVHPSMVTGQDNIQTGGVEVRTNRSVLPNHFWIGVKDDDKPRPA